jgi:dienelactone hydrolase
VVALLCVVVAVQQLERAKQGLSVQTERLGTTPITVWRPAGTAGQDGSAPVVLIAHGFAGSQQLMHPLAVSLARNGFLAITFDFPGHGRNTAPMRGGLSDTDESLRTLLQSMSQMGQFAQGLAGSGPHAGRYAVLGHSMASDIVVRHAQSPVATPAATPSATPAPMQTPSPVLATVGISLFAPSIGADTPPNSPPNLLVIAGALEPQVMAQEALRVVGRSAASPALLDTTYGSFDQGSARRASLSPGVEHIGVLYSTHTLRQTLDWLNTAFERPVASSPFIDSRGAWLGLLLLGVLLLAWPLSALLPVVGRVRPATSTSATTATTAALSTSATSATSAPKPDMGWWGRRGLLLCTLGPALLTPLLLWALPHGFLPILLGDYLALHFGVYGLLTAGLLWKLWPVPSVAPRHWGTALLAVLLASAYALLAVGGAIDQYMFNLRPEAVRWPLMLAVCAGTLPFFLADEFLTRHPAAPRGAYVWSKLCFLLSLVLAIALNPSQLFFLAMIVPVVLLLFLIYGCFSHWVRQSTGHPAVAAIANALAFGCFIAITFPLVG